MEVKQLLELKATNTGAKIKHNSKAKKQPQINSI